MTTLDAVSGAYLFRIYWTDTMHGSIESIDFNGGDHKILFEENSKYPYSLAVDQVIHVTAN